jgi:hypothetical protein
VRTFLTAFLLMLISVAANAATIKSLEPPTFAAGSGEHFLTISGEDLGDTVLYEGKAGKFELPASAAGDGFIVVWVPEEIINLAGRYSVTVAGRVGPAARAIFDVTESSAGPLVLLLPDPIVAEATSRQGARVSFEVWPHGGRDPNPSVKCSPASGSLFPLGTTEVRCTASNTFGDRAEGLVSVLVYDGQGPRVKVPDHIIVRTDLREGAIVQFEVSAEDDLDGEVKTTCDTESGSLFPIGRTTVVCMAEDSARNRGYGSFDVDVLRESRAGLELHLPDAIEVNADGPEGASVAYEVTASGTDDPSPWIECDFPSESLFPIGKTEVTCRAGDVFGNSAKGSFTISVTDAIGPHIDAIEADPSIIRVADGKLHPVSIRVDVTDLVDGSARCEVQRVTSNQSIADDWHLLSALELELRAEVDDGQPRIYDIWVSCVDKTENPAHALVTVTVDPSEEEGTTGKVEVAPATSRRRAAGARP